MRNDINKIILAKLESRLYNQNCKSVLSRGNISARVDILKNEKPAYETASRYATRAAGRKQVKATSIQQA